MTLLERTTRWVSLTSVGEALLEPARRTLMEDERAGEAVEAAKRRAGQTLTVGAFGFAAYDIIARIGRDLADADPPVWVIQLEVADRDAVRAGQVDVALGTPLVLPASLEAEDVFVEPGVVALRADHPLAADGGPVSLADLATGPVAMPAPGVALEWDRMIAHAAANAGVTLTAAPATFRNLATAVGVASEGRYPALLTGGARKRPLSDVVLRPIAPPLTWATAIIWSAARSNPAIEAFLAAGRRLAQPDQPGGGHQREDACGAQRAARVSADPCGRGLRAGPAGL